VWPVSRAAVLTALETSSATVTCEHHYGFAAAADVLDFRQYVDTAERSAQESLELKKLGLTDPLQRFNPTTELRQHWEALRNTKDEVAMARELMWIVRYENTGTLHLLKAWG
jgi:hypothetical protein